MGVAHPVYHGVSELLLGATRSLYMLSETSVLIFTREQEQRWSQACSVWRPQDPPAHPPTGWEIWSRPGQDRVNTESLFRTETKASPKKSYIYNHTKIQQ